MPLSDFLDDELDRTFYAQTNNISSRYNAPKITFVDKLEKSDAVDYSNTNVADSVIKTAAKTHHQYTTTIQTEYFIKMYNEHAKELELFHDRCYLQIIKAKFFEPLFDRIAKTAISNRLYTDPYKFATNVKISTTTAFNNDLGTDVAENPGLANLARLNTADLSLVKLLNKSGFEYKYGNTTADIFVKETQSADGWLQTPLAIISQTWNLLYINCVIPLQILFDNMEKISSEIIYLKTILSNHKLINTKVHFVAFESSRVLLGRMHQYVTDFYRFLVNIYLNMKKPSEERKTEFLNIFSQKLVDKPLVNDARDPRNTTKILNTFYQLLICLEGCPETKIEKTLANTLHRFFFPANDPKQTKTSLVMSMFKWFGVSDTDKTKFKKNPLLCFTLFEYTFQFEFFLNELSKALHMDDVKNGNTGVESIFMNYMLLDESSDHENLKPTFGSDVYDAMYKHKQRNILTNSDYLKLVKARDSFLQKNNKKDAAILLLPDISDNLLKQVLIDLVRRDSYPNKIAVLSDGIQINADNIEDKQLTITQITIPHDENISMAHVEMMDDVWFSKVKPYRVAYTSINADATNKFKNGGYMPDINAFNGFIRWDNTADSKALVDTNLYNTNLVSYLDFWVNGEKDSGIYSKYKSRYDTRISEKGNGTKQISVEKTKDTDVLKAVVLVWETDITGQSALLLKNKVRYDITEKKYDSQYYHPFNNDQPWQQRVSVLYSTCDPIVTMKEPLSVSRARKIGRIVGFLGVLCYLKERTISLLFPYIYGKIREWTGQKSNSMVLFMIDTIYGLMFSPYRNKIADFVYYLTMGSLALTVPGFGFLLPITVAQLALFGGKLFLSYYLSVKLPAFLSRIILTTTYRAFLCGILKVTNTGQVEPGDVTMEIIVDRALAMWYPIVPDAKPKEKNDILKQRENTKAYIWPIAEFIGGVFATISDLLLGAYVHQWLAWLLDIFCISPFDLQVEKIKTPVAEENPFEQFLPKRGPKVSTSTEAPEDVPETNPEPERSQEKPEQSERPREEDPFGAKQSKRSTTKNPFDDIFNEEKNKGSSGTKSRPQKQSSDSKKSAGTTDGQDTLTYLKSYLEFFFSGKADKKYYEQAKQNSNSGAGKNDPNPMETENVFDPSFFRKIEAQKSLGGTATYKVVAPNPNPPEIYDNNNIFSQVCTLNNEPAGKTSPFYSLENLYAEDSIFTSLDENMLKVLNTNTVFLRTKSDDVKFGEDATKMWVNFLKKLTKASNNSTNATIYKNVGKRNGVNTALDVISDLLSMDASNANSDKELALYVNGLKENQLENLIKFTKALKLDATFNGKDTSFFNGDMYEKSENSEYNAYAEAAKDYASKSGAQTNRDQSPATNSCVGSYILLTALKKTAVPVNRKDFEDVYKGQDTPTKPAPSYTDKLYEYRYSLGAASVTILAIAATIASSGTTMFTIPLFKGGALLKTIGLSSAKFATAAASTVGGTAVNQRAAAAAAQAAEEAILQNLIYSRRW